MFESRRTARFVFLAALVLSALGVVGLEWCLRCRCVPLGVPGEWTWDQYAPGDGSPWSSFVGAALVALGLAVWIAWGLQWVATASRRRWCAGLGVTTLLVAVFQVQVETSTPDRLWKWTWALYFRHVSGYYTVAKDEVDDVSTLLVRYDEFLARHAHGHIGTHPPGLFVVYRSLLTFFEEHPYVAAWVAARQPRDMADALRVQGRLRGGPIAVADQATLFTAAVLSRVLAVLVVLPVAWLVRLRASRNAAWVAAACAGLVPAAILFAPKSDTVFPTLAALILALSCAAVSKRSWLAGALAGLGVFLGMFFSLAFLAVGVLAGLMVALQVWHERQVWFTPPKRIWGLAAAALAGWLIGPALLWVTCGHNIVQAWLTNLEKHAQFYSAFPRSYWPWVGVNLVELAVAMGLPAAVLLMIRLGTESWRGMRARPADALAIAWLVVLLLLNFSGKNLSEVARLWLFLMPLGVVLGTETLVDMTARQSKLIAVFIILQAAVCMVLARDLKVLYAAAAGG